MKVLLVEDDENKCAQLVQFIRQNFGVNEVEVAKSFHGGLDRVLRDKFDLILLDMSLPTYDVDFEEEGGRPRAFAGRDILRRMERRGIEVAVVVVTQFERFGEGGEIKTREQLDKELAAAHPSNYRGMVYYNAAFEEWKEELGNEIRRIVGRNVDDASSDSGR